MGLTSDRSHFFYQNNTLSTLKKGDQTRAVFRHNELPLAEQHGGTCGTTGLIASDSQQSVLSVHGDQQQNRAFTAYGHDLGHQQGHGVLGFNGEHFNKVSGSYVLGNGYRAYSPVLMRFRASDTWSPFGRGGLNSYAYCNDDPINHQDPSGHVPRFGLAHAKHRIVRTFKVEHYETLTTTQVTTMGKGAGARSEAINTTRRTLRTTKIFEVLVNPEAGPEKTYVTKANLKAYLRTSENSNALTLAADVGDKRMADSSVYLSSLESFSKSFTIMGESLVRRAADPLDLTAYWQGTFRVSQGAYKVRNP